APSEALLDVKPEPKLNKDDAADANRTLSEKGKALFASVGCANCHQLNVDRKPIAPTLSAPALVKLKADGGCLADTPAKGAASFNLSARQKAALAAAL